MHFFFFFPQWIITKQIKHPEYQCFFPLRYITNMTTGAVLLLKPWLYCCSKLITKTNIQIYTNIIYKYFGWFACSFKTELTCVQPYIFHESIDCTYDVITLQCYEGSKMLEAQHFKPPWMYTLCICWGAKSTWVMDTWKKKKFFHSISCWLSKYYKLYYIKNNIIRCLTWIEQNPVVSKWHSNYKWEDNFVKEMHISLSPNQRCRAENFMTQAAAAM